MNSTGIPYVEAYRPKKFDDIVLDPLNKKILTNIIETGYFPNLLFYGPPGTGKTTTIINLVSLYQERFNQKNKELMIHLNASDERGIDIIRSQISQFVNSKTMFTNGMKFVILDEVDSMTKNAQQALKYLLQNYSKTVRFCLIGNYISRIDEGLQTEFFKLKFNQLPEKDIIHFLNHISVSENLNISEQKLHLIQKLYKFDMRSMINFIQSNQNMDDSNIVIIDNNTWETLYILIKESTRLTELSLYVTNMSKQYNIDKKNIMKDLFNYIIRRHPEHISPEFLNFIENIIHVENCKTSYYVNYSLIKLSNLFKES
jgi:DNA polymerase III delta prime subunit